jgi:hypothetical protein
MGRHSGVIAIVSAAVACLLTVGLVWWLLSSTKDSVCRPVLRLVEKPQPAGLNPSQIMSFEYNQRAYVQLYASLGC